MINLTTKAGYILLCGLFFLSTACTTVKPIYDVNEKSFAGQLKPGDRVRLTYLSGIVDDIRVTDVTEDEVRGTIYKGTLYEPKGHPVVAKWNQIDAVELVRISPLKTAGAGVGVVVAIPFLIVGALMAGSGS